MKISVSLGSVQQFMSPRGWPKQCCSWFWPRPKRTAQSSRYSSITRSRHCHDWGTKDVFFFFRIANIFPEKDLCGLLLVAPATVVIILSNMGIKLYKVSLALKISNSRGDRFRKKLQMCFLTPHNWNEAYKKDVINYKAQNLDTFAYIKYIYMTLHMYSEFQHWTS